LFLLFASAGVFHHAGIKIPYFAFFGHDSGRRVREAPFNMLLAMGLAAALCILVGLPLAGGFGYGWLYGMLPYPDVAAGYHPYTPGHILTQMQLLVLAILAFMLLKRFRLYPPERPGVILDTDWLYRKLGYGLASWLGAVWGKAGPALGALPGAVDRFHGDLDGCPSWLCLVALLYRHGLRTRRVFPGGATALFQSATAFALFTRA